MERNSRLHVNLIFSMGSIRTILKEYQEVVFVYCLSIAQFDDVDCLLVYFSSNKELHLYKHVIPIWTKEHFTLNATVFFADTGING